MVFEYFGQIGDCVFLAASAYFLHKSTHRKLSKVAYILSDAFFFSVVYLCIYLALGKDLNYLEIIRNIFSVTCGKEWFVGCYILLYMSFPYLNNIISGAGKRGHLSLCLSLFFLYSIISNSTLDGKYLYSRIIGAIEVYFIVAYASMFLRQYFSRKSVGIFFCSLVGMVFSLVLANLIAISVPGFMTLPVNWCSFINPFIMLCAISLLFIFSSIQVKENRFINCISSLSLLYYIIYENYIFRNDFKPIMWAKIYDVFSFDYVISLTFGIGIIAFLLLTIIASIYSFTIRTVIHRVGYFAFSYVNNIRHHLIDKIISIDE